MLPVQDEEDMEKTIEICHCCNCPEINCQVQSRKQGTEPINHNAFSVGLCGIQGVLHHRQPQKNFATKLSADEMVKKLSVEFSGTTGSQIKLP
jgi:hypothetical protein